MKRIAVAVATVACLAASAHAADPFAVAYGNTVTQTLPDGSKAVVYVNADGTWERHLGQMVVKGTYVWKDPTHACFTVTEPKPQDTTKATSCSAFTDEHHVGDTWTEKLPDGTAITIAITAGR